MYNPIQLGVEADASRAVNEIPTPNGVASATSAGSSTGVSLTAFLFSTPISSRTPHDSKSLYGLRGREHGTSA